MITVTNAGYTAGFIRHLLMRSLEMYTISAEQSTVRRVLKGSELTLRVSGSGHSKEATEAMTKNPWKRAVCEVTEEKD